MIACAACEHRISSVAESCPSCGHPNRASGARKLCYQCDEHATLKCQKCGTESCLDHLEPTRLGRSKGLLCDSCQKDEASSEALCWVLAGVLILFFLIAMAAEG